VWAVDLTVDPEAPGPEGAEAALSQDERARGDRFRRSVHRRRFRASRIALRRLLSLYSGVAPGDLVFEYGPLGKPGLAGRPLQFNLAHTEDLALVAVTREGPVGVDVERIRPSPSLPRLVRRVLSPAERRRLEALPEAQRPGAFYLAWTRKEALIKARGDGVFTGLGRIEVTLTPGEPARVLSFAAAPQRVGEAAAGGRASGAPVEEIVDRWFLQDLCPAPGFAAAVAVEVAAGGAVERVRTWRWSG
jgi:4'-phosphopantetheinyl transferase